MPYVKKTPDKEDFFSWLYKREGPYSVPQRRNMIYEIDKFCSRTKKIGSGLFVTLTQDKIDLIRNVMGSNTLYRMFHKNRWIDIKQTLQLVSQYLQELEAENEKDTLESQIPTTEDATASGNEHNKPEAITKSVASEINDPTVLIPDNPPAFKKQKTYFQDEIEKFYLWLGKDKELTDKENKSIVSAARISEMFLRENISPEYMLFSSDIELVRRSIVVLRDDARFKEKDAEQNGKYYRALEKIAEYNNQRDHNYLPSVAETEDASITSQDGSFVERPAEENVPATDVLNEFKESVPEKTESSDPSRPDNSEQDLRQDDTVEVIGADTAGKEKKCIIAVPLPEKIEEILREECAKNPYGTTISFIKGQLSKDGYTAVSSAEIKRTLTASPRATQTAGAWKYKPLDEKETTSSEDAGAPEHKTDDPSRSEVASHVENKQSNADGRDAILEIKRLDFAHMGNLSCSKPQKLIYFGDVLINACTWEDLYTRFVETLYKQYPNRFRAGMSFLATGTGRIDLGSYDMFLYMRTAKVLNIEGQQLLLETDFTPEGFALRMKKLLDRCNIDYNNVEIIYAVTQKPSSQKEAKQIPAPHASSESKKLSVTQQSASSQSTARNEIVRTAKDRAVYEADPIAFRSVYATLKQQVTSKPDGSTATDVFLALGGKIKRKQIVEVLKSASWSKALTDYSYLFSDVQPEKKDTIASEKESTDFIPKENWIRFDFTNENSLTGTIPAYCDLDGYNISEKNWSSVMAAVADRLLDTNSEQLQPFYTQSLSGKKGSNPFFLKEPLPMQRCIKLHNGYWVYVNLSTADLLRQIKALCQWCGYNDQNAIFYGETRVSGTLFTESSAEKPIVISWPKAAAQRLSSEKSAPERATRSSEQSLLPPEASLYSEILSERFVRGFRIGSGLDMRKFKRYYEEKAGTAVDKTDAQIEEILIRCGIRYDEKVFVPAAMLPADLRDELFGYIRNSLNSGKTALYYEAIFKEFSERFLDHYIYSADMLKSYIAFYNNGEFYLDSKYLSREAAVEANPFDDVKEYLLAAGVPVESDQICQALSHIPQRTIMQILGSNAEFINNGVLVANGANSYFYIDIAELTDEDLENIAELIQSGIEAREFLSGNDLIEAIRARYPHILESNAQISPLGMRDAIKYRLKGRFSFNGNVISRRNQAISMSDVFGRYAKDHPVFTVSELAKLAEEMNTSVYFDDVYVYALRIDAERFVSKDLVHFQITETDAAIANVCSAEYFPLKEIQSFSFFPDAGYPWNTVLLESYVYSSSRKYHLLHSGFNKTTSVGAVVKRSSGIDSFDALLARALADSTEKLDKDAALDFFVRQGYLARRMYSNVQAVLLEAKTIRNKKG